MRGGARSGPKRRRADQPWAGDGAGREGTSRRPRRRGLRAHSAARTSAPGQPCTADSLLLAVQAVNEGPLPARRQVMYRRILKLAFLNTIQRRKFSLIILTASSTDRSLIFGNICAVLCSNTVFSV